ncbi:hypothetical protein GOEFS_055_00030 [Gordonia effusa NBRC 100432]|uniref:DUF2599 domain-containing protein n=1 Tax=Gordonia effusa NBRC 100432 TaxID=1077974 RepID=H0R089_9ACTN|nr:DUF2599 domain-containing protein [Gordonia effusa]GAB18490.1 hypothetical protein GOEFS_055_00030 [Gordonia effusa NBRC 100432]
MAAIFALPVAAAIFTGCGSAEPTPAATSTVTSDPTPTLISTRTPAFSTSTTPDYPPPYIDHVQWATTDVGASLQVYPTTSGRKTSAESAGAAAWREVIAAEPSANTPTMKAQFDCHWTFARLVDPMKTSWNLEPARPVVTDDEMIATRCNPGGAEEGPAG